MLSFIHLEKPVANPNAAMVPSGTNVTTAPASNSGAAAAVSNVASLSPAHQMVNKLNILFQTLFTEDIIFYYPYFPNTSVKVPTVFFVKEGTQQISTHSLTHKRAVVDLFKTIPNTTTIEDSWEGGSYFNLSSSDNFQALLGAPDSQLKQKLITLLEEKRQREFAERLKEPPRIKEIMLVYVNEENLEEFTYSAGLVQTAMHFNKWVKHIIEVTESKYFIKLESGKITLLSFRIDGFAPQNPDLPVSAKNPLRPADMRINTEHPQCDHHKLTPKTVLTVRIEAQLFAKIKAQNDVFAAKAEEAEKAARAKMARRMFNYAEEMPGLATDPGLTYLSVSQLLTHAAPAASANSNASGAAAAVSFATQAQSAASSSTSHLSQLAMFQPVPIASSNDSFAVSAPKKN